MSAVLSPSAGGALERSEGVWHAAWRRFKTDRVGMVSALIVVAFLLLILASWTGLIAKNWQDEVGVANAPPTLLGPRPPEAIGTITDRPARMSGLPDRGRLEAGLRADLVRVARHDGQAIVRQVWCGGERVA